MFHYRTYTHNAHIRMITYTIAKKKTPFDWNDFLDRAMKNETSFKERTKAVQLASSWVTCACGNQCDIIDRDSYDGEPMDENLSDLGMMFYHYVEDSEWKEAKKILKKIEKRSAKLIEKKINDSIEVLKKFNYKVTKA